MKIGNRINSAAAGIAACVLLASCQQAETPSATTEAATPELPLSINEVMVAVTDRSADYIFAAGNGDLPQEEHDWDLMRTAAYQTILSGQLIKMHGTGENDVEWAADPGWQSMSDELTDIGQEALTLALAKSTDVAAWRVQADRLIQNCLACHEAFKPEVPSQGVLHESTERESRGISIFD